MHRQLRYADINRAHTAQRGNDRADGGAACAIVAHHKLLQRHGGALGNETQRQRGQRRCGVALVAVDLEHDALVHVRLVVLLVLLHVVGVQRVRHLRARQEQ